MKQAAKEALSINKLHYEKMKAILRAYATKRECSFQEEVYLVMLELWLRKIFPKVIFLNSNLPDKRYKVFKRKMKLMCYLMITLTYFSAIGLFVTLTDQVKVFKMVLIKLLINTVLQSFYLTTIL